MGGVGGGARADDRPFVALVYVEVGRDTAVAESPAVEDSVEPPDGLGRQRTFDQHRSARVVPVAILEDTPAAALRTGAADRRAGGPRSGGEVAGAEVERAARRDLAVIRVVNADVGNAAAAECQIALAIGEGAGGVDRHASVADEIAGVDGAIDGDQAGGAVGRVIHRKGLTAG